MKHTIIRIIWENNSIQKKEQLHHGDFQRVKKYKIKEEFFKHIWKDHQLELEFLCQEDDN